MKKQAVLNFTKFAGFTFVIFVGAVFLIGCGGGGSDAPAAGSTPESIPQPGNWQGTVINVGGTCGDSDVNVDDTDNFEITSASADSFTAVFDDGTDIYTDAGHSTYSETFTDQEADGTASGTVTLVFSSATAGTYTVNGTFTANSGATCTFTETGSLTKI